MTYDIKKAVVIGSGTMGGGIAGVLAGIGVETLLLDIPAKDTQPGDPASKRNPIVQKNLKTLQKMRPAQLFHQDDLKKISIGNIDDDLHKVAYADWVVEVVVERLDIKQNLMAKVAEHIGPNTIVSTNTSGLPLHSIAEHLDEDFTRRFLGTHFFNPPRYLRLLEIIPHPNTASAVIDFMMEFGSTKLGKGTVLCKDTPNFIGNRFMSMSGMQAMNYALNNGYTVEEVDALTGPLIGRPKTATFNLNDLVGFDIAVGVARNLYDNIPNDPQREVLNHPNATKLADALLEKGWLGRKSGQGFYLMKRDGGKKELWALNLNTLEYEPPTKPRFDSVGQHRKVEPLGERIKLLINSDDRAGQYLWHLHAFLLAYASNRVPEITDTIVNIDNAQKWGFNHQMGPFEIWDAIGISETIDSFEEAGYPVADWVKEMVSSGHETFYQTDEYGKVIGYYSPQEGKYVALEHDPREITIADLRASGKEVWTNGDGSIYDLGDGVLLWEFRTKQNSITPGLVESGWKALDILDGEEWKGLIVGNDAERFSIGANLDPSALMSGVEGIEKIIKDLQDLTQGLRYAVKPVVIAGHNMALGGGCELLMSGAKAVVHMELYTGLVEVGVGLVPAGGGCKELVRRLVNPLAKAGSDDIRPGLQKAFQNIATAQVSESAKQAKDLGFLAPDDKIVMNRAHLLGEAKAMALALSESYTQEEPEPVFASGRDWNAALMLGVEGFTEAGYASEYDGFLAKKVAYILTGGGLAEPQFVPQDYLMTLERKAFTELIMETKTQERIMHMLQTNKPLRN